MARQRSHDKRNAILEAAVRVFAERGLGAATAVIAKEAGVSNGSLFVYFDTKSTLLNELYVWLKTDMQSAALAGVPRDNAMRAQVRHLWDQWIAWAATYPERRKTLALLQVSREITAESHEAAREGQEDLAALLEKVRVEGPMREVPFAFALTLANAIAEAAMDTIIAQPAEAEARSAAAFEAMWRVLAG
jgi:AcrR family transcriptional regulator